MRSSENASLAPSAAECLQVAEPTRSKRARSQVRVGHLVTRRASRAPGGGDHGCGQQTNGAEHELAPNVEARSQRGWERWERERVEASGMYMRFFGEEDVVAAGEVPVLGGAAHDADAAGEHLVGF